MHEIELPGGFCVTGRELVNAMNSYFIQVDEYPITENTPEYSIPDIKRHQSRPMMLHPTTPFEVE